MYQRIRDLREDRDLSQEDIAFYLNIHHNILRLRTGEIKHFHPNADQMILLLWH